MQQRPTPISSLQLSPRRKPGDTVITDLPVYDPRCNVSVRRSRSPNKWWIHTIPLVVFLSLFILWWLSYPVHLVIKDGRIAEIRRVNIPQDLVGTYVDITILAAAATPTESVPYNISKTETEAVSSI